jgi:hypothetical protein
MARLLISPTDGIDNLKKSSTIHPTQKKEQNMINIGSKVMVGSRIGNPDQRAVVVDIIPGNEYREAMYRVRFPENPSVVTITPNPNECWVDAPLVWPDLTNSYCG